MTAAPRTADRGAGTIPASRTSVLAAARAMRRDPLGHLTAVAAECGGIGGFALGPQRVVVVTSPALVHELLVTRPGDFGKGRYQLRALRPLLGDGLLTSEGTLHDDERRAIAPLFHNRRIRRWADVVVDRTAAWAAAVGEAGRPVDALREMYALSMAVVGELLLSTPLSDADRLGRAVTTAFEWEMYALTRAAPLPVWSPTPRARRTRAALALIRRHIRELVEDRRSSDPAGWPEDVLSDLLALRPGGRPLPDVLLEDELLTLFGASQETIADTLAWALYLLATHPAALDRVRAEVEATLGDRPVRFDDLAALPYALQVVKETLRLYPPAAVVLRAADVDTELGGAPVRRGTIVMVSPYLLHRDPAAFPEPERFDPDRFAPHAVRSRGPYSYLPFGAGPRACIGASLTLMVTHLVLVTAARSLDLAYAGAEPPRAELVINLRPRGGLPMHLRGR